MAAHNADSIQPTKISFFAKLWPLLLSGLVLIIPLIFCLGNFYITFKAHRGLDYAVLVSHRDFLLAMMRLSNIFIVVTAIGILIGIGIAVKARTFLRQIAVLFSIACAILLMLAGYFFGILVNFRPVDSLIVESKSFNLGYFHDDYDTYYLYECDTQGLNCKTVWEYDVASVNSMEINENNRQIEILIEGEIVYTHPIE